MNFEPFLNAPVQVQIHAVAAAGAFGLGLFQVFGPRFGRVTHIIIGVIWTLLMLTVAGTALFITGLFGKWWSPIHLFIPVTLYGLWQAFSGLRSGQIRLHAKHMRQTYFFALLIAGAFTFVPGRMMWNMFIAPFV